METEKSFSGEEAEKDFCGRLFFLAAIFPFSNEKACLGVIAKTDFFYRLKPRQFYIAEVQSVEKPGCGNRVSSAFNGGNWKNQGIKHSFHFQVASFFRFMAANLSFTQLVT